MSSIMMSEPRRSRRTERSLGFALIQARVSWSASVRARQPMNQETSSLKNRAGFRGRSTEKISGANMIPVSPDGEGVGTSKKLSYSAEMNSEPQMLGFRG